MSRTMWMKKLIGGTANLAQAILYSPTGRAQTNVKAELDRHNTKLTELDVETVSIDNGKVVFHRQGHTVHMRMYAHAIASNAEYNMIPESMRPSLSTLAPTTVGISGTIYNGMMDITAVGSFTYHYFPNYTRALCPANAQIYTETTWWVD